MDASPYCNKFVSLLSKINQRLWPTSVRKFGLKWIFLIKDEIIKTISLVASILIFDLVLELTIIYSSTICSKQYTPSYLICEVWILVFNFFRAPKGNNKIAFQMLFFSIY